MEWKRAETSHFWAALEVNWVGIALKSRIWIWQYCLGMNSGISLLNKLQKLQNRAVRVLTYPNYDEMLVTCSTFSGEKIYRTNQQQIQTATMVYKSLHGLALEYLSSKFESWRATAYNLRDSVIKHNRVLLPSTNYYKNSFSYSGSILWNSLPCWRKGSRVPEAV